MNNKNQLVDKIDQLLVVIADWSIRHRLLVIIAALVLLVVGIFAAGNTRINNSYDAYFDKSDPAYAAYLEYLDDFSSDEVSYLLYTAPQTTNGPFDIGVMKKIALLTKALEQEVPFVRDATSLANVEFISAEGDDILVDELLVDFPESQQDLLRVRDIVMRKPLYVDYLINKDKNYSAIILEMALSSSDPLEKMVHDPEKSSADINNLYPQVSDHKIREILARPEYEGIEFYLAGDVHMNTAYNEILATDSGYILLATLVIIVALSFLLFRATLIGMLGPISVVLCSVLLTVGFISFVGMEITLFFSMIPTLLCAVGVAQSVHILLEFQRVRKSGETRNNAVKASLKKVGGPCLMAALTTATGFLAMYPSELRTVSEMAIYAPVGIMLTFLFSITLLVIFLAGDEKPACNSAKNNEHRLAVNPLVATAVAKAIAIDLKAPRAVIGAWSLIFLFAFIGISKLSIDFNFLKEFKPHVEWRKHTEKAESVMGGLLNVAYVVDTKQADGIKDPQVLQSIEKIQRFAEQLPLVKKTYSVTDIIKDMNQTYNGDDPEFYKLPSDRNLSAQYFLLYELAGGKELDNFVSQDFSRAVLELRVEMAYASKVLDLQQKIDAYIQDQQFAGIEIKKTGIGLLWVKFAEYIGNTQMVSYSLVFVMIACFMCISFGSIKVGMLSMVPNLAPVVLTLGTMGWLGIPLDYMKMMLATIAIGIAVDDTIHLVTRYRKRFLETGSYEKALSDSLDDVGPALIITTIILVGAFSAYFFSSTTILASFGALLAAAIAIALLADLFLMPVLLMKLKPFGKEFDPATEFDEQ
ncbi:MAG: MMPL family transporter [Gammaproteobacteria bacterium]|nr:MMPL family transporter [Gammaproteobacteria bacterium]